MIQAQEKTPGICCTNFQSFKKHPDLGSGSPGRFPRCGAKTSGDLVNYLITKGNVPNKNCGKWHEHDTIFSTSLTSEFVYFSYASIVQISTLQDCKYMQIPNTLKESEKDGFSVINKFNTGIPSRYYKTKKNQQYQFVSNYSLPSPLRCLFVLKMLFELCQRQFSCNEAALKESAHAVLAMEGRTRTCILDQVDTYHAPTTEKTQKIWSKLQTMISSEKSDDVTKIRVISLLGSSFCNERLCYSFLIDRHPSSERAWPNSISVGACPWSATAPPSLDPALPL